MQSQRPPARDVRGILLLDKPRGITSNRALQQSKRLYRAAKAGHTGSLDPLATGMLPICFGAATRVSSFLLDARKRYRVVAQLGAATDTGDADGQIVERRAEPVPSAAAIDAALARFVGEIKQIPPMYSALKRDGVPLYRLARRGVEVPREPREVTIHSLVRERFDWPELELVVSCSKGTYIRTLVADLAASVGTLGHVRDLRRLDVTPFAAADMRTFDALEDVLRGGGLPALDALLLPADAALPDWPRVGLDAAATDRLLHGQAVPAAPGWATGWTRVYGAGGDLVALAEVTVSRLLEPRRVFGS